jgi:hypothetical protein
MATNKIALRTVEEFMGGYTPVYNPIYPLFLGKSQQYAAEVGRLDFRRVNAVGDIRAKHVTPKDTEMRQVAVMEGKKSFRKYFLANQFTLSDFQDRQGVEDVVAQVLDEHHVQADELFLTGEGTSSSDVINNGLLYSADANYTLRSSTVIASTDSHLTDLHAKITASAVDADQVAGRKLLVVYGTAMAPVFNSVYSTSAAPFKRVLSDVLGSNYSTVMLPRASTPSGANGWVIANLDQTKLHYTALPSLLDQGNNAEKMYLWFNFLMGSMMLEVLAQNGVIHQPCTFA